ncbi:hypothetical protein MTO96_035840, partial [Rhipicephalus appendiculatus]
MFSFILGSTRSYPTSDTKQQFCCPNELLTVLRGVNSSIDPCEDFYGHVCSRIDSGDVEHVSPLFRVIQQLHLVGMVTPAERSSAAGEMLATIRRGLRNEERGGEDIGDYVTAISKALSFAPRMDFRRMVRSLAELALRYGLPSVVSFMVSEAGTILIVKTNNGYISQKMQQDKLVGALESLNNVLNTAVSLSELLRIEQNVADLRKSNDSRMTSQPVKKSPLADLPGGDWNAILNDLVLPVHPNVATLEIRQDDNLNGFFNVLGNGSLQPAAVAYAAVYSALTARELIEAASMEPTWKPLSTSCQALDICEIEQAYMVDVLRSHSFNQHVTTLFANIRDNVIQQFHASFHDVPIEEASQKLRRLRLVLPEEIVISDIPVPTVSGTFADNFIAARSHIFEVRKAKVARNIPSIDSLFLPTIVRHGDAVYFPTNLYAIVQQRVQRTVALDVPVLGVDMAYQLWSFLLEQSWSPETKHGIETYKACFNGYENVDYLKTADTTLGVVSAIDATAELDWNVIRNVNGTETTIARLVYLMWAYDKCAPLQFMGAPVDVNMVVRNSPAFRDAFACPKSSAMA